MNRDVLRVVPLRMPATGLVSKHVVGQGRCTGNPIIGSPDADLNEANNFLVKYIPEIPIHLRIYVSNQDNFEPIWVILT